MASVLLCLTFLFTFVRVVQTFYAFVKTGEVKWPFCYFHMEAKWPRASSDSQNDIMKTPLGHPHTQTQGVSRNPRRDSLALKPTLTA